MIFFLLHQVVQKIPGNLSDQTRNLITFLLGVMLYTFLWTYVNSTKSNNFVVTGIRYGFYYIFVSDCFAMGIIYKNYYNRSIRTEISSAWGTDVPVADTKINTNNSTNSYPNVNPSEIIQPKLNIDSSDIIEETTDEILNETPITILEEITTEIKEEN